MVFKFSSWFCFGSGKRLLILLRFSSLSIDVAWHESCFRSFWWIQRSKWIPVLCISVQDLREEELQIQVLGKMGGDRTVSSLCFYHNLKNGKTWKKHDRGDKNISLGIHFSILIARWNSQSTTFVMDHRHATCHAYYMHITAELHQNYIVLAILAISRASQCVASCRWISWRISSRDGMPTGAWALETSTCGAWAVSGILSNDKNVKNV